MSVELLQLRTEQLLSLTDADRDSGDESNPILFAESGPNRFSIMSLFFSDSGGKEDGVRIQEDLDLNEITVEYFTDTETIELKEGPIYEWALEFYKSN